MSVKKEKTLEEAVNVAIVSIFKSVPLNREEIEAFLQRQYIEYAIDENGEFVFSLNPADPLIRVPKERLRAVKEKEIPKLVNQFKMTGQLARVEVKIVRLEDGSVVYCIVDGMHRVKVCSMLDLPVKIQTNQRATLLHSMLHNIGVVKQDKSEVYNAIAECISQGMSYKEIAQTTGYKEEEIETHFKVSLLPVDFRAKVLKGEISFLVGKEIAGAIASDKFTREDINQLIARAEGDYIDPVSKNPLPPASVANIQSAKRSITALKKSKEKAAGQGKARPDFTHEPTLIQTRLESVIEEYKVFKSQAEAMGFEELDERAQSIVNIFDFIMNMRAEDIQAAYEQYKANWGIKE